MLLLSVAPEVKIMFPSSGVFVPDSAPSNVFFALAIISIAAVPILWSELAFPNDCSIAAFTAFIHSAHGFVVAALSRYIIKSPDKHNKLNIKRLAMRFH